ncbi:MAG: hypothetical protein ACW987_18670 [Candidatus Thorarchaeota archaeon]|jgi:hypothetical protein
MDPNRPGFSWRPKTIVYRIHKFPCKTCCTRTTEKNRTVQQIRTSANKYKRKAVKELYDCYVLDILTRGTDLTRADIPPEVVELKRQHIFLRRAIRNENDRGKRDHGRGDKGTTPENRVSRSRKRHSESSRKILSFYQAATGIFQASRGGS